jgi:hypothetical protein
MKINLARTTSVLLLIVGIAVSGCTQNNQTSSQEITLNPTPNQTESVPTRTPTPVATNTPEPELEPLPSPTPTATVTNLVYVDYDGITRYGLTFEYPEKWYLLDPGDHILINNPTSELSAIYINVISVPDADTVDLAAFLEQNYPSLAFAFLSRNTEVLEPPTSQTINGLKTSVIALQVEPKTKINPRISLVNGYMAIMSNGNQLALIQGVTTPDEVGEFRPVFEAILNSVELQQPSGPRLISPGESYYETKNDLTRPNLYRLTGVAGQPVVVVMKPEQGLVGHPVIGVFDYDQEPAEGSLLAEAKGKDYLNPVALFFTPDQDADYLVTAGTDGLSQGDFSIYVVGSDTAVSHDLLFETGVLEKGDSKDFNFEAKVGEIIPIAVQAGEDANITFEIYDLEGNLVKEVDNGSKGQQEVFIFVPELDASYTLKIYSDQETGYSVAAGKTPLQ